MQRVIGFILTTVLGIVATVLLSPLVIIALVTWGTLRSFCMAKGKHKFVIGELLQGKRPEDLLCVLCRHKASGKEPDKIRTEYAESLKKLIQTKDFLNGIFRTAEEKAIDQVIEESKDG